MSGLGEELAALLRGLPESWSDTTFNQIAAPERNALKAGPFGSALKKSMYVQNGYKVYGQEQVIASDEDIGGYYIDESKFKELESCKVVAGDLLLSLVGTAGKVLILSEKALPGIINPRLLKISLHKSISRKYIAHYLKSYEAQQFFDSEGHGGTMTILNLGIVSQLPIPLPPFAEQIRIADKLDALLARVDAGRDRLERVPKLLKHFRQSVLSAAVSGELTREWRGGGDAEWEQIEFAAACREITVGFVGKMADEYRDSGIPFLRSQNVRPLRFDSKNLLYISKEFDKTISKSSLAPGDVVVVRSGAPGQCCVIPDTLPRANCSDVVIVRPNRRLDPHFAAIFINAETSQKFVRSEQVGVAQLHFNVGSMKITPLSLPSLAEQAEIVRRVEALFAIADRIEQRYASGLASFARLTPALLAKAFRGELVPQDPNDEPASLLLERIRAQRAADGTGAKHGRKPGGAVGDGTEPRFRGRPPKAQADGGTAEPKRRGRPPKVRPDAAPIAQASNYEDAVRQLEAQKLERAQGSRQVGLFEDAEVTS